MAIETLDQQQQRGIAMTSSQKQRRVHDYYMHLMKLPDRRPPPVPRITLIAAAAERVRAEREAEEVRELWLHG